jgi:hypothetical protein
MIGCPTYPGWEIVQILGDGKSADLVCHSDELVQLRVGGISRKPQSFTVVWIRAAGKMLLLAGVDDRNTVSEEYIGNHALGLRYVAGITVVISISIIVPWGVAYLGNRGLSWFSMKFPRRVGSLHLEATELIIFERLLMLPLEDLKALTSW